MVSGLEVLCPPWGEGEPFYAYGLTPLEQVAHSANVPLCSALGEVEFVHHLTSSRLCPRLCDLFAKEGEHFRFRGFGLSLALHVCFFPSFAEGFAFFGVVGAALDGRFAAA